VNELKGKEAIVKENKFIAENAEQKNRDAEPLPNILSVYEKVGAVNTWNYNEKAKGYYPVKLTNRTKEWIKNG
jgi:hypothetical protein